MYVGKREYETIPLTDHWVFLYALWYNLLLQLWTKSYANWHRILSTIWLWIYWFAWFFKDAKSPSIINSIENNKSNGSYNIVFISSSNFLSLTTYCHSICQKYKFSNISLSKSLPTKKSWKIIIYNESNREREWVSEREQNRRWEFGIDSFRWMLDIIK
jgi:hypothetical protein